MVHTRIEIFSGFIVELICRYFDSAFVPWRYLFMDQSIVLHKLVRVNAGNDRFWPSVISRFSH
jgi:hypothetical protein